MVAGGLRSTPGATAGSLRRTGQRRLMEHGDGVASAGAAPHSELSSLRDKVGYVFYGSPHGMTRAPFTRQR